MKLYIGICTKFWGEMMKNYKGNILISLLFILVIFSVLSLGIYGISYSASKHADYNEVNVQAYYIAKSAADLVLKNIDKVRSQLVEDCKTYDVRFSYGEAEVTVTRKSNTHLNIVSLAKIKGKEGRAEADVIFYLSTSYSIFAVDDESRVYSIMENDDGDFTANEIEISVKDGEGKSFSYPKSFAWDFGSNLILVGGGNGSKELKALVYDIEKDQWTGSMDSGNNYGNAFVFATYAEEENGGSFYAIEGNNNGNGNGSGKILKFDILDKKWEDLKSKLNGFKGDKLARGNKSIVLISEDENGKIYYIDENNNGKKINIPGYGMYGRYKSIVYGKDKFIVVGYESSDYPIILYSEDGENWSKINDSIISAYELNEVTWTKDKFIAVGGAGSIIISDDGVNWSIFPRKDIIKDNRFYDGNNYWYANYTQVSGYNENIVAINDTGKRILISKDGGEHWDEKPLTGIKGKLVDMIVFKGVVNDAQKGYSVIWSE